MKIRLYRIGFVTFGVLIALIMMVMRPQNEVNIRYYHNNYNGLITGISTKVDAVNLFGNEIKTTKNSNNMRYEYETFSYTINDHDSVVNSIIIFSDVYKSDDGISVGDSTDRLRGFIDGQSGISANKYCVSNTDRGITYWIADGRVKKIALASWMVINDK